MKSLMLLMRYPKRFVNFKDKQAEKPFILGGGAKNVVVKVRKGVKPFKNHNVAKNTVVNT